MNYYVVSPNVYNDGNIDFYLNEMLDRQIVIMGYSKEDKNKWVNMFKNAMKIGDCVIVARGANYQKKVFFAGIISSEALVYNPVTKESMYREIDYLTDLKEEDIPFNTDCAFGESRQSGSIYQLKPNSNPADKAVTDKVSALIAQTVSSQVGKKRSFSLKEISSWSNESTIVSIPGIQRGLVWKPSQVELLWDSILRGFPIGTFTLSESDTEESKNSRYYLMDGQQRFNSIALAFDDSTDNSSILWIDIAPTIPKSSTRKFMVRLTTMAHPWGYQGDDNCSVLSTQDKRTFLDKIGRESVYKTALTPRESYPFKSNKPIPLSWMLNAPTEKAESFIAYLNKKLEETSLPLPCKQFSEEDIKTLGSYYYGIFRAVKLYRVGVSIISPKAIDKETEENKQTEQPEALEVLFRRIGTGGTQITQEELNYSAIKAYWPKELREENDRVAQKYMNPERLVRLAFRLALTNRIGENISFQNDLSIQGIRKIAQDCNSDEYLKITDLYLKKDGVSKISKVMDIVDQWLIFDHSPKFLRTSIARNSPDVYLLMMFFASEFEKASFNEYQVRFMQSVAFYLHWFASNKNQGECANVILNEYLKSNIQDEQISLQTITFGIFECIRRDLLPLICFPSDLTMQGDRRIEYLVPEEQDSERGFLEKPDERCGHVWNLISQNKEMLLYAQREYLYEKFPNYDPAQRGMWEQHNRPWDLDHIIPQDWVYNKRGKYREFCKKWLWKNGNFAAISFESNRSKNNQANWDEYEHYPNELYFSKKAKSITPNLTFDKSEAVLFGEITFDRTKAIYRNCHEMLSRVFYGGNPNGNDNPFLLGVLSTVMIENFSERILERQRLLLDVKDILENNGFDTAVRWTDDKYSKKEFEIDDSIEVEFLKWAHPWLTVGFTPDNEHYVCICTQDGVNIEIGVRKHPNESQINGKAISAEGYGEHNEWWYAEKDITLTDWPAEKICDELLRLKDLISE